MITYLILSVVIIILILLYYFSQKKMTELLETNEQLLHDYKGMAVKHGQSWEQFLPFTKEFESIAHKENFTFIGMPIDGIAFEDDAIKFIEVKTGKSQLSNKQKQVKELIQKKQVEWHELRF